MADDLKIKKGDFIELDYTGTIAASQNVFDTTQEAVAKKHGIFNKNFKYKPAVIVVGESHILKALDDFIEGKTLGNYKIDLEAEKAFGKKDAKLLRLIAIKEFHKHKVQPVPGLEVELDNARGIVRTVNGGRVIVDFNHPLASQDLVYEIKLNKIVTDDKDKLDGLLNILQIPFESTKIENNSATIKMVQKFPEELTNPIKEQILKLIKFKDVVFE